MTDQPEQPTDDDVAKRITSLLEAQTDVKRRMSSYPIDTNQQQKIEILRESSEDMGVTIARLCPESRERSLALTKLEEALMWAVKSISHQQPKETKPNA